MTVLRVLAAAMMAVGFWVSLLHADDFRVETQVFSGEDKEPVSKNLTLFRAGKVYDYLSKPVEITVFDKQRERIFLLDPARRVKTELKTDELIQFNVHLQTWAASQTDSFLKFAARPLFEQKLADSGELTFHSKHMTYRVASRKAATEAAARQYREFADLYCRLNCMTRPGALPPFARLTVNDALAKSHLVPEQVSLLIPARKRLGGKDISMRSEHRTQWRLLESDLRRIDQAGEHLVTFTPVPLQQYLKLSSEQAKR